MPYTLKPGIFKYKDPNTGEYQEVDVLVGGATPAQIIHAVAPTEVSSTASVPHAVGSYFIFNGVLYETTVAIAQGDTITPDTNCQTVPNGLGGEVSELKDSIDGDIGAAVEEWIEAHPDAVGYDDTEVRGLIAGKVAKPSNTGSLGQVLKNAGNGATVWASSEATDNTKVPKPATEGTAGQVLKTNGDGTTIWADESGGSDSSKVPKPVTNPDGTSGQVLKTNGDGTTVWADEYSYDDSYLSSQISGKVNKPGTAGTAGKVLKCAGGNATVWADDTSTDPTKVAKPTTNPNGTSGQVLKTNGDGTTYWGNESSASDNSKVSKPTTNPDGTSGQVLKTNGNGTTAWVNVEDFNSLPVLEASSSGDFNLADTNGNVVLRLENGHIKTQKFDSENVKKPLEHYQSAVKSFVRGTVNTLTISHFFQKGERVFFHMEDDAVNWEYGHCADYYEGSNLIIAGRRGSQGYFEHVISQNCQAVSVKLAQNEYTDGTDVRLHVYVVNGEVKPTIITVSADGKKMFTTLKAAVESIQDASSVINPYVIEVYPGEYNTLEGYSEEQIQSADTSGGGYTQDTFVGLKLTDGISIRGVGGTREKIILKAELSTTDYSSGVRGNISTLNIQGSGFIENMTIIGKNLRYCVHDDFIVPTNTHGWRRLKDLKFVGENLAYAPQFTTYGAGMATPRDYYIENCDFGFDLGIHSNNKYSFGCRIEAVHCTGHRFRIGDYASAEAEIPFEVYVNDCNFDIIRVNRANASLSSHVRLMGTGGAHSMIKTPDDEIYQLGMIDKTAAGFQKGTLLARVSGGASFAATQSIELACGVVIAADSNYSYIQREGYVASNMIGLTGLTLGGSVTVDSNNKLISGGSSGNRVGIVKAVDTDGIAYIHLWH